jgi:bifunctional non-homologous end joining protein LigD
MAGSKFNKNITLKESRKLTHYVTPMLAKESVAPFDNDDWIFEIKWDGFRAIAEISNGDIQLYSRNGNSFLGAYPEIVSALKKIKQNIVIDGEIVVLNDKGFPDFQKLQDYDSNRHMRICFFVFDLLVAEEKTLYHLPLTERKKLLKKLIGKQDLIRISDHVEGDGTGFFNEAVQKNLEGVMAKHKDSLYYPGKRSGDWLKVKNHKSEDVIIAGYTAPAGARNHFGSLVLAMKDGKEFRYIGNAGTGYDEKKLKSIYTMLQPFKTETSPFREIIKIPGVTWVEPSFVCEVKFTERTKDGKLRHPVFLRLREDKKVKDINMKTVAPVKAPSKKPEKKSESVASKKSVIKKTADKKPAEEMVIKEGKISVPVSHPEKLYWPDEGITKGMMVQYYQSVAEYILPYLKNRPQSLNRNPGGIMQSGFYHKDAGDKAPSWVKSFPVYSESSDKQVDYIICNDKQTMAYLNNLGCIELNPWHSVMSKPDHPDYLIIDLDPSDNNTFDQVIEAALHFKELFDKAGAPCFCKTSGSSGIHIYVPTAKKYTYEQVKDFAHVLCMMVQDQIPDFTTLERNLKKRGNDKMYLDFLQNRKGQTIASVYSLRPKPGAPVSMPLHWKEVKPGLSPRDFTIHNALKRIKKNGDIFKGVLGAGINITTCLKKIGGG